MNRTEYYEAAGKSAAEYFRYRREEALQYYNEYFNDAGPENEQNVIEALGNPAKVAENIKKIFCGTGTERKINSKERGDTRGG